MNAVDRQIADLEEQILDLIGERDLLAAELARITESRTALGRYIVANEPSRPRTRPVPFDQDRDDWYLGEELRP